MLSKCTTAPSSIGGADQADAFPSGNSRDVKPRDGEERKHVASDFSKKAVFNFHAFPFYTTPSLESPPFSRADSVAEGSITCTVSVSIRSRREVQEGGGVHTYLHVGLCEHVRIGSLELQSSTPTSSFHGEPTAV